MFLMFSLLDCLTTTFSARYGTLRYFTVLYGVLRYYFTITLFCSLVSLLNLTYLTLRYGTCLLPLAGLLDGVAEELHDALGADLSQRAPLLRRRALAEAVEQRQSVVVVRLGLWNVQKKVR